MKDLTELCRVRQRKHFKKENKNIVKVYRFDKRNMWKRRQAKRREEIKEYIAKIKSLPCTDCKNQYNPWQMHFDHLKPKNKIASISFLVNRGCSIPFIQKEINKCELVCANCHANRTYTRAH